MSRQFSVIHGCCDWGLHIGAQKSLSVKNKHNIKQRDKRKTWQEFPDYLLIDLTVNLLRSKHNLYVSFDMYIEDWVEESKLKSNWQNPLSEQIGTFKNWVAKLGTYCAGLPDDLNKRYDESENRLLETRWHVTYSFMSHYMESIHSLHASVYLYLRLAQIVSTKRSLADNFTAVISNNTKRNPETNILKPRIKI